MTRRFSREWEARLLGLVDQMVEAVAVLARTPEEARSEQLTRAASLAEEAAEMAVELLEGHPELLEQLMEQLVAQRLPHFEWPKGVAWLQQELQEIVRLGVQRFREKANRDEDEASEKATAESSALAPEPALEAEGGSAGPTGLSSPADPVVRALSVLFPGREVREDYPFHGTVLGYYLPEERLAVAVEGRYGAIRARQEYFCRLEGITLVVLDSASASNPWRAAQAIRRVVRRRAGQGY